MFAALPPLRGRRGREGPARGLDAGVGVRELLFAAGGPHVPSAVWEKAWSPRLVEYGVNRSSLVPAVPNPPPRLRGLYVRKGIEHHDPAVDANSMIGLMPDSHEL